MGVPPIQFSDPSLDLVQQRARVEQMGLYDNPAGRLSEDYLQPLLERGLIDCQKTHLEIPTFTVDLPAFGHTKNLAPDKRVAAPSGNENILGRAGTGFTALQSLVEPALGQFQHSRMGAQMFSEGHIHTGCFRQKTTYLAGYVIADVPAGRQLQRHNNRPAYAASIEGRQPVLDRGLSQFQIARLNRCRPESFLETVAQSEQRHVALRFTRAMAHQENSGLRIKRTHYLAAPYLSFGKPKSQTNSTSFCEKGNDQAFRPSTTRQA